MLLRKPGSDTALLLVCIPATTGNITVLVSERSFQNLVEGGKLTLWKVSASLEGFESGYSLMASEAG